MPCTKVVVLTAVSLVDVKCRPDDVFCTVNKKSSVVIFSANKSMVVILACDEALLLVAVPARFAGSTFVVVVVTAPVTASAVANAPAAHIYM